MPTFTIFTPTYNRVATLPRLYESLQAQTFKDFDWLVIDDGSTDGTPELFRALTAAGGGRVQYLHHPNVGKHRTMNRGIRLAKGHLILALDSDDLLVPNALERFLFHWNAIPEGDRDRFVGVSAHTKDLVSGKLIGTPFPTSPFDSDSVESEAWYGVTGDKQGFHVTDILRRYPFPEIDGERHISEGIVWNRIALSFKTRYVNEVLAIKEYLPDGISDTLVRLRAGSPQGASLYYKERADHPSIPVRERAKALANYVRFSTHAGRGPRALLNSGHPLMAACVLPIGLGAYALDRWQLRSTARPKGAAVTGSSFARSAKP
jgi:glycosyltransferase involved in cell wall biosynthesis